MPCTDGHQTLPDISPSADAHAETVAGVLVHEGPIGAAQHAPFRLGHLQDVARPVGAGVKDDLAAVRRHVPGQTA